MHDDTNINFRIMNEDLRIRLIQAVMGEAIECGYDDDDLGTRANLQAIVRVKDGEPIVYTADEDTADEDLDHVSLIARIIDYHWGNFA